MLCFLMMHTGTPTYGDWFGNTTPTTTTFHRSGAFVPCSPSRWPPTTSCGFATSCRNWSIRSFGWLITGPLYIAVDARTSRRNSWTRSSPTTTRVPEIHRGRLQPCFATNLSNVSDPSGRSIQKYIASSCCWRDCGLATFRRSKASMASSNEC